MNKEKILEFLEEGKKSSTELSSLIQRDYYTTLRRLGELEKEHKIKKIKLGRFTFWEIIKNEI